MQPSDLPVWNALGTCLLGVANTGIGRTEEGLAQIRKGLDLYRELKTPPVFWPLLLYVEAGAYGRSGRPAEALGMIEEAIEIAGSEMILLPEFYLLKGELLLAVPEGSASTAERWLQRGFDMAEGLDARMPQLRAAIRLSRLRRDQGKPGELSQPLRRTYETFTEDFATADLREASDLLSSLP